MSEYKLKEIFAPQLGGQPYGQNLKDQFDAINTNFKLLANRDFVKGDKGDSVRTVLVPIYDATSGLTAIGSQVVEALLVDALGADTWGEYEQTWKAIENKTVLNINKWISDNNVIELSTVKIDGPSNIISFIDNATDLSLILIQTFDPSATNPTYTNVAFANNFVLRDNRFVGAALTQDDLSKYSDLVDVSGTATITIDKDGNYIITVLHDFPALYYADNAFRWKIGGQPTGIIAQGPSGINGKDGTIYMVKVSSDQAEDKPTWLKINAVWDRIGSKWKPNPEDPSPVTDYIKEGDTCVAFLNEVTESGETTTNNKIYITTVVSQNDVLYAICADDQQIQFDAGLDIVEKFMNRLPDEENNWVGLHVCDTLTEQDGQPFYQHMIRSYSDPSVAAANHNESLNVEPLNRKTTGAPLDPVGCLNLKYNTIRLGFDNANDFSGDVRDSQIIAYLYGESRPMYPYRDRAKITLSHKSIPQDNENMTYSCVNLDIVRSGELPDDFSAKNVFSIGQNIFHVGNLYNGAESANKSSLSFISGGADSYIYSRKSWPWDSDDQYTPLQIRSSNLYLSHTDVFFGSTDRASTARLSNCVLNVRNDSTPDNQYLELFNSGAFIEYGGSSRTYGGNGIQINSYYPGAPGQGHGDLLLNAAPYPADSQLTEGMRLSGSYVSNPGKVQVGSSERKSNFEVYGSSTFKSKLTIVEDTGQSATKKLEYSLGYLGYKYSNSDSDPLYINGKLGDAKIVSIGSSAHACSLKIYGDATIGGSAAVQGNAVVTGIMRGNKACGLSMFGGWDEQTPTRSINALHDTTLLDWSDITGTSMKSQDSGTIVTGKGLVTVNITGQNGTDESHNFIISDAPQNSLVQLGIRAMNASSSHDLDNVKFYIRTSRTDSSGNQINEIIRAVPAVGENDTSTIELLIWLDSSSWPHIIASN